MYSIKFNELLMTRNKTSLEDIGKVYDLFGVNSMQPIEHEGKKKIPLNYPVAVEGNFFKGTAYFAFREDLAQFIVLAIAITGEVDISKILTTYELLDDDFRVKMNNHDIERFRGVFGDAFMDRCKFDVLLGRKIVMREKEVHVTLCLI